MSYATTIYKVCVIKSKDLKTKSPMCSHVVCDGLCVPLCLFNCCMEIYFLHIQVVLMSQI